MRRLAKPPQGGGLATSHGKLETSPQLTGGQLLAGALDAAISYGRSTLGGQLIETVLHTPVTYGNSTVATPVSGVQPTIWLNGREVRFGSASGTVVGTISTNLPAPITWSIIDYTVLVTGAASGDLAHSASDFAISGTGQVATLVVNSNLAKLGINNVQVTAVGSDGSILDYGFKIFVTTAPIGTPMVATADTPSNLVFPDNVPPNTFLFDVDLSFPALSIPEGSAGTVWLEQSLGDPFRVDYTVNETASASDGGRFRILTQLTLPAGTYPITVGVGDSELNAAKTGTKYDIWRQTYILTVLPAGGSISFAPTAIDNGDLTGTLVGVPTASGFAHPIVSWGVATQNRMRQFAWGTATFGPGSGQSGMVIHNEAQARTTPDQVWLFANDGVHAAGAAFPVPVAWCANGGTITLGAGQPFPTFASLMTAIKADHLANVARRLAKGTYAGAIVNFPPGDYTNDVLLNPGGGLFTPDTLYTPLRIVGDTSGAHRPYVSLTTDINLQATGGFFRPHYQIEITGIRCGNMHWGVAELCEWRLLSTQAPGATGLGCAGFDITVTDCLLHNNDAGLWASIEMGIVTVQSTVMAYNGVGSNAAGHHIYMGTIDQFIARDFHSYGCNGSHLLKLRAATIVDVRDSIFVDGLHGNAQYCVDIAVKNQGYFNNVIVHGGPNSQKSTGLGNYVSELRQSELGTSMIWEDCTFISDNSGLNKVLQNFAFNGGSEGRSIPITTINCDVYGTTAPFVLAGSNVALPRIWVDHGSRVHPLTDRRPIIPTTPPAGFSCVADLDFLGMPMTSWGDNNSTGTAANPRPNNVFIQYYAENFQDIGLRNLAGKFLLEQPISASAAAGSFIANIAVEPSIMLMTTVLAGFTAGNPVVALAYPKMYLALTVGAAVTNPLLPAGTTVASFDTLGNVTLSQAPTATAAGRQPLYIVAPNTYTLTITTCSPLNAVVLVGNNQLQRGTGAISGTTPRVFVVIQAVDNTGAVNPTWYRAFSFPIIN